MDEDPHVKVTRTQLLHNWTLVSVPRLQEVRGESNPEVWKKRPISGSVVISLFIFNDALAINV